MVIKPKVITTKAGFKAQLGFPVIKNQHARKPLNDLNFNDFAKWSGQKCGQKHKDMYQ